jgi:cell division protein FtsB
MEHLDVRVKKLTDENEQLKRENARLSTEIQTVKVEVRRPNSTPNVGRRASIVF